MQTVLQISHALVQETVSSIHYDQLYALQIFKSYTEAYHTHALMKAF